MRRLVGGISLLASGAMALLSFGALSNLWADYQDSSTGTYLAVGLPWLVMAVAFAVAGVLMLKKP